MSFFVSGPAVIAQPLYQSSTADLDLEDGVQYVTLEEFFNDKSEIVPSTNQGIIYIYIVINRHKFGYVAHAGKKS